MTVVVIGIIIVGIVIWASLDADKMGKEREEKGIRGVKEFKYYGGFKNIGYCEKCFATFYDDRIDMVLTGKSGETNIYEHKNIKFKDILDVEIQTESQIRESVSLGKLIAFGIFAFGMEKKQKDVVDNYLIIKALNEMGEEMSLIIKVVDYVEFTKLINEAKDKLNLINNINSKQDVEKLIDTMNNHVEFCTFSNNDDYAIRLDNLKKATQIINNIDIGIKYLEENNLATSEECKELKKRKVESMERFNKTTMFSK